MTTFIVYSSTTGNTKAVSEYMASKIPESTCLNISEAMDVDISAFDRIVLGTRVHADSPSKDIVSFIERNRDAMSDKKTAYFLCCMFGGEKGDDQCKRIGEKLGISNGTYFVGGKKLIKTGGSKIDEFIDTL